MASITRFDAGGVAIFAPAGAGAAGGISFADYHYYADLAAAATYTPTALTFATFFTEVGALNQDHIHVELYDGAGWIAGISATVHQSSCAVYQDNAQSLRITNGYSSAWKFSLTGVVWTGLADYHYYTDLATAATYTPTAQSLATLFCEYGGLASGQSHVELYDGAGWVAAHSATPYQATCTLYQDTAQSLRVVNGHATVAIKISLTGATWS